MFIGYRFYDHREIDPRYCFGHGLGYHASTIDSVAVTVQPPMRDGTVVVAVSARVTNLGNSPMGEVVQVYVAPFSSKVLRPNQELKGFERVELEAGGSRNVSFRLDRRAFSHWDPAERAWTLSADRYRIRIGHSSRDIAAEVEVDLGGTWPSPR